MSGFTSPEKRIAARALLIQRIKERLPITDPVLIPVITTPAAEETWEQSAKRRRLEKQEQVGNMLV